MRSSQMRVSWKKLTAEVGKLNKLIQICYSISIYFHHSEPKTNESKQIVLDEKKNNYTY